MTYKVMKKYGSSAEQECKSSRDLNEVKQFVKENSETDFRMGVKSVYRIYDFDELLQEVDSSKVVVQQTEPEASTGGAGKGAKFSPTPLANAPRPPGMPQNWKEEGDEKDGK